MAGGLIACGQNGHIVQFLIKEVKEVIILIINNKIINKFLIKEVFPTREVHR